MATQNAKGATGTSSVATNSSKGAPRNEPIPNEQEGNASVSTKNPKGAARNDLIPNEQKGNTSMTTKNPTEAPRNETIPDEQKGNVSVATDNSKGAPRNESIPNEEKGNSSEATNSSKGAPRNEPIPHEQEGNASVATKIPKGAPGNEPIPNEQKEQTRPQRQQHDDERRQQGQWHDHEQRPQEQHHDHEQRQQRERHSNDPQQAHESDVSMLSRKRSATGTICQSQSNLKKPRLETRKEDPHAPGRKKSVETKASITATNHAPRKHEQEETTQRSIKSLDTATEDIPRTSGQEATSSGSAITLEVTTGNDQITYMYKEEETGPRSTASSATIENETRKHEQEGNASVAIKATRIAKGKNKEEETTSETHKGDDESKYKEKEKAPFLTKTAEVSTGNEQRKCKKEQTATGSREASKLTTENEPKKCNKEVTATSSTKPSQSAAGDTTKKYEQDGNASSATEASAGAIGNVQRKHKQPDITLMSTIASEANQGSLKCEPAETSKVGQRAPTRHKSKANDHRKTTCDMKGPETSESCQSPPRKMKPQSEFREIKTNAPGTSTCEGNAPEQREQEMSNFTCLLANMGTDKKSQSKSRGPQRTELVGDNKTSGTLERYKLLQPIFDTRPDFMFLQEVVNIQVCLNQLKRSKLQYHHTYSNDGVVILAKKSTIGAVETFTDMHLKKLLREADPHETYKEMVEDGHMRICFLKATPVGKKYSVLLVSYHGRQRLPHVSDGSTHISDDKYCEIYTDLLKICQHVYLWGDKVSMLTHIYPHKPWREIEVTICKITRLIAHFMCGLMSDLLICTCL